MIRTGLETEEDWLEFLDTLEEMLQIRDSLGANTAFQFSFTPLVVYDNIPLRYEPRVTAQQSYEDTKNMGWVLDRVRDLGNKYNAYIRCKFNGRGPGTFIEQLLLDGGRSFTKPMIRVCMDDKLDYQRNFGDDHKNSIVKWCNYYGIDVTDIFRERSSDELFWSDSVQFVTEIRLNRWKQMHDKHDYSQGYCLHTNSSEGHCYGCRTCPDANAIKSITKRDLSHAPIEEVIASLSGERVRSVTRLVLKKQASWKIYSNETLCHYVASKFLQEDLKLLKAFHKVSKNNTFWASSNDQKDWFSGVCILDIEWKEPISAAYLNTYVERINEGLNVAKIVKILDIDQTLELTPSCECSYLVSIPDVSMSMVKDKMMNFDWMIKTLTKGASGTPEVLKEYTPEYKDRLLFIQNGNKVLCYMHIHAKHNPYYVLSSILGKNVQQLLASCDMSTVGVSKEVDAVCSCGKRLEFSMTAGLVPKTCPVCQGKVLLYKATH